MERVVVALVIVVVAAAVAIVLRRRQGPDAPTQARFEAPTQLDRRDFPLPDTDWLLVAFTSATCHTCADTVAKAQVAASRQVAFTEVEFGAQPDLHRRYRIGAVPTLVLADGDGVVRVSYLGRVTATDLWAAIADAREPGVRPDWGNCHRDDPTG